MMMTLPKTTILAACSLTAQVMATLSDDAAARLADCSGAGHAGMTDVLAEVALSVVAAGIALRGTLDGFWEAVAEQTGGVPLYEVADAMVTALVAAMADEDWSQEEAVRRVVEGALALATVDAAVAA